MSHRPLHHAMRRAALPVAALVALAGLAGCAQPPERPPISRSVWMEQNWTAGQRQWFHHASQGTATLPVDAEWFLALEQPGFSLTGGPLIADPAYLARWGFIASPPGADNPDGLPVGFARTPGFADPGEPGSRRRTALGFTCAACHTGQITYRGTQLLVDGGSSQADITGFSGALGIAVLETHLSPLRFDRFARRVLKERYGDDTVRQLRDDLKVSVDFVEKLLKLTFATREGSVHEGFGRLDALNRIGNQVFALDTGRDANYAAVGAPVSLPHIWSTSWFTWVQYDGSIMQPLVRNAGEAMGVGAAVNLAGPAATRFASTVDFRNLARIEAQLAGATPALDARAFTGLAAPKWPEDILGPVDRARAARGRVLYDELCAHCHLPAPDSPAFWDPSHWTPLPGSRHSYLKVNFIPLEEIGTDPAQAGVLADRTVDTTGIGLDARVWLPDATGRCAQVTNPVVDSPKNPFGAALGAAVQQTIERWYRDAGVPPAEQPALNGDRPNCLRTAKGYRARPLNGVWATPPFLHNGSVPTLDALLRPVAERPARFWLGHLEYDPQAMGLVGDWLRGGTEVDTRQSGNRNTGHEFSGDGQSRAPGVIGRGLNADERAALLEFLKTI